MFIIFSCAIIAALLFNLTVAKIINRLNKSNIQNTTVQNLLFDDGWIKESSYRKESEGFYRFSKNNFVIYRDRFGYVLSNVVPTIHTIKTYSKLLNFKEVEDIIATIKNLS